MRFVAIMEGKGVRWTQHVKPQDRSDYRHGHYVKMDSKNPFGVFRPYAVQPSQIRAMLRSGHLRSTMAKKVMQRALRVTKKPKLP